MAAMTWRRVRFSTLLGLVYAIGVLIFVLVEYVLIGFEALQGFEALLAAVMVMLLASDSWRSTKATQKA